MMRFRSLSAIFRAVWWPGESKVLGNWNDLVSPQLILDRLTKGVEKGPSRCLAAFLLGAPSL